MSWHSEPDVCSQDPEELSKSRQQLFQTFFTFLFAKKLGRLVLVKSLVFKSSSASHLYLSNYMPACSSHPQSINKNILVGLQHVTGNTHCPKPHRGSRSISSPHPCKQMSECHEGNKTLCCHAHIATWRRRLVNQLDLERSAFSARTHSLLWHCNASCLTLGEIPSPVPLHTLYRWRWTLYIAMHTLA